MTKLKAIMLLNEVITFYLDMHKETADIKPTNIEIEQAEYYIEKYLS